MSNSEKTQAIRETREHSQLIRATREQWKAERLHELAEIFQAAFEETRA